MPPIGLLVCTTCFGLTSAGSGMQRCRCEVYKPYPGVDCPSGFHLCFLCAASVAGGTGRYSWNACEVCLKYNKYVKANQGFSLPLGRHSIMNGVSIPMALQGSALEEAIDTMWRALDIAGTLEDWGLLQARELFESVPVWKRESYIALNTWEAKFKLTGSRATSRSASAFKGYLGS